MRYRHVCLEALACTLPPEVVSSAAIEERLAAVYQKLQLPAGRLELMTGIRERRFWPRGVLPGQISAQTANAVIEKSGIDRSQIGALIHGSVCRDQLEPATAASVHHATGLPPDSLVCDFSNACLGLLNGVLAVANMIELGQIRAGLVVGTEMGRDLVEGTIDSLLATHDLTRQQVKLAFASLTIGSGSAAILLCDRKLSRTGRRLVGGVLRADTSAHQLCAGGVDNAIAGDSRPRMQTDSEALLHAGVRLAGETWTAFLDTLGWGLDSISKVVTHQVGKVHRKMLLERLGINPQLDFPTVEFLGNTGAVALPMTAALGEEAGHVQPGDRVAWLGIGSGLSSVMLGTEW